MSPLELKKLGLPKFLKQKISFDVEKLFSQTLRLIVILSIFMEIKYMYNTYRLNILLKLSKVRKDGDTCEKK